jgi:hypothetical protein
LEVGGLLGYLNLVDIVFGFAEAVGRDSLVLFVVKDNLFPQGPVDLLGNVIVAHTEEKFFRQGSGYGDHGKFPFPGPAEPSLMGELLDESCPIPTGKAPGKREPGIAGKPPDHEQQYREAPEEYLGFVDGHRNALLTFRIIETGRRFVHVRKILASGSLVKG